MPCDLPYGRDALRGRVAVKKMNGSKQAAALPQPHCGKALPFRQFHKLDSRLRLDFGGAAAN